jgi:hypothetical protein
MRPGARQSNSGTPLYFVFTRNRHSSSPVDPQLPGLVDLELVAMSTSPHGRDGLSLSARLAARAAVLGLTLAAAGCASDGTQQRYAYAYPGTAHVTAPAPRPPVPRAEIEDDGLPAQAPPLRKRASEPDDPTEPFSPNYGTVPVRSQANSPVDAAGTEASAGAAGRPDNPETRARPNAGTSARPPSRSGPQRVAHNGISTSAVTRDP